METGATAVKYSWGANAWVNVISENIVDYWDKKHNYIKQEPLQLRAHKEDLTAVQALHELVQKPVRKSGSVYLL